MIKEAKHITFIPFTQLVNWDAKFYIGNVETISSKQFPLVTFGHFTKKAEIEKVKIEDNKEYEILGVRSYGLGTYRNRVSKGSNLKMKVYQQAKQDHLFWCKVDTKNGAFGIISKDLKNGLGSSNMTFAELNLSIIDTNYLQILFRSKKLHDYMDNMVTGSTNRKYIKFSELLTNVKIPLPSIDEQNKLVAEYNKLINLATEQEEQAIAKENEIEEYIIDSLDIKITRNKKKNKLNFIYFKDTSRWDIPFFINENITGMSSKYPMITYNSLIVSIKNGIAARNYAPTGLRFLKVTDIKNNSVSNNSCFYINKYEDDDILPIDSLLITRKGTVGQSTIIREKNKYCASSEVFIIQLNKSLVNLEYFSEMNLSKFIQQQFVERYTGTIMPSMSQDKLKTIKIPLPPIEIQNKIATHISELKEEIRKLRTSAVDNRKNALLNFEERIF